MRQERLNPAYMGGSGYRARNGALWRSWRVWCYGVDQANHRSRRDKGNGNGYRNKTKKAQKSRLCGACFLAHLRLFPRGTACEMYL